MTEEQQNNPLSGLKLEDLLTELVEFYGWETLADKLRFDCFASNPNIEESLEFLRDTDWAREKLEAFYLYNFKRMPIPHDEQFKLPPRERSFAPGVMPRDAKVLTAADKSKPSKTGKQHFAAYHKSSCDKGYCTPKKKP